MTLLRFNFSFNNIDSQYLKAKDNSDRKNIKKCIFAIRSIFFMEYIDLLKKKKLNIEKANFTRGFIPNYIILDKTRNIFCYIDYLSFSGDEDLLFNGQKIKLSDLINEYLKIQFNELDRPFFLFLDNYGLFAIEISYLRELVVEGTKINTKNDLMNHILPIEEISLIIRQNIYG